MEGVRRIKSPKRKFFFPIFLLLPLWLTVKLGQIPQVIFKRLFSWLYQIIRFFFKLVTNISLPRHRFNRKRGRGRPRELPLHLYLRYKYRRFLKRVFPSPLRIAFFLGVFVLIFFSYSLFLINISRDLPSPEKLTQVSQPLTTQFYDRSGKLLYRLYEGQNRSLVKLPDLPSDLINATIAIEDRNFWGHRGVDFFAISRAALADFQNQNIQGGSTITQQLIKNTLLTPERTWQRKLKEVALSFWTERIFSKQQILEMYFNSVPYGGPAWGVEAAAETYFNKHAHDLSLAESSYLAGLPAAPTNYSPFGPHPELGKERQKEVLEKMAEDGFISRNQAQTALNQELSFRPAIDTIKAPHFVMYVRSLLTDKYGEKVVSQGGLKITTSLDLGLQQQVENIVTEEVDKLSNLDVTNGAAMVEDPKTGQILAMVGSKDYFDANGGNYNVALALRQPGSSIKPITYSTAFKQGYSPGNLLLDGPITFSNPWGAAYSPVNYDDKFHGVVSIRTALGSSYNVPAVKMLNIVGIPNMIKTAHDMGITTLNDLGRYGLSLTLGGGEVRLIDMMSVYSTLSQLGLRHPSVAILKVTDSKDQVLEDNTDLPATRALGEGVSFMITDILSDNSARTPAFGPNSLLNIPGHIVAVKTGTTDNKKDNWTFGYTPDLVVGVWVGNNDGHPMNPALTSGITGAAPIWNRLMTMLLADKPNIAFQRPTEVVDKVIDGHKDLAIAGQPPKVIAGQIASPSAETITLTEKH